MEQAFFDLLRTLFSRSDPMLAACILALGYWIRSTNKKLDRHMDSHNREPHAFCALQGKSIDSVSAQVSQWRTENREDHQQIFDLLRGGK